jgi:hypothetical protein
MQMRVTTRRRRAKELGDTELDDGVPCLTIFLGRAGRFLADLRASVYRSVGLIALKTRAAAAPPISSAAR